MICRHWVEEGERLFLHHDSVIRLRESLLTVAEDADKKDLEKFFLDELKERPTDIRLQIRLVRLYEEWGAEESGRYKMAYDYSKRVEAFRPFSDSREWYQALCDVTESYMKNGQMEEDSEAQTIYLTALERLTYLTIAASSSTALLSQCAIAEAVLVLHKFDEKLNGGLEIIGKDSNVGQLLIGQLYLHMATVLLHPTNKDVMNQDQTLSIGALLLHACHYPPSDTGGQARASGRDQHWYKIACHRMSQATHTLNGLCKDEIEKSEFLNKVKQQCSNKDTRSAIHRLVFGAAADKGERGFFINDSQFITAPLSYPEASHIKEYDHVVSVMVCANLNELVWLCLRQVPVNSKEPQPYYSFPLFDGLQFSSTYMNIGAPESMCHLDLLAFLAATVFCHRTTTSTKAAVPTVVSSVCTSPAQCEWWSTAYTLFTSHARQDLGKLRRILQRGLEVIRAVGNHGIDLAMMAHLARCFSHWANLGKEDGSAASEVTALEERANHYWGQVLSMCQRPDANISSILPKNRMFVSQSDLTCEEREEVELEGKIFSAKMKLEAIQALGEVKSPEASFQITMEARPSPERLDAQMRYLSKIQEMTLRTIEEQNSSLRVQNEALTQTFITMAQNFRENVALNRSLLDQNKKFFQESNSSILDELKNIHEAIKDLQDQMKMIVEEVAEMRNIKATEKQVAEPVTREEETTEGQSSLDIQSAPMVPGNIPALYDYVHNKNHQPLPSTPVAQTGLFPTSQLPFFPPSTMPEQSSGVQVTPLQTVTQNSQVSVCASTPTRDTGSTTFPDYTVAQSLPSNGKMPSSLASSSLFASSSRLSSPVTSAIGSNKGDKSAPHAFQIAMPTTPGSINPPENQGRTWMAMPLTTTGLLAGVPAPIFSAVSPTTSSQTTTSDSSSATKVFGTILPHAATSPIVSTSPKEPQPRTSTSTTGLFKDRSKLFHFVENEWKEQGTGRIKLLYNKKKTVRVLMRRDQADKFKEVFEEAQKTLGKEEKEKSTEAEADPAPETKSEPEPEEEEEAEAEAEQKLESESEPVVSSSTDVTPAPSLASLFKPAPGSWECSGCFIRNKAEVNTCPACNTNKPGYEPPTVEETKPPTFSFGLGKSVFGSAPSTASTTTTVSFSFSCSKPQTTVASSISTSTSTVFSGFKFSLTNTSKESSTTKAFTFGTPQTSNKSITSTTPFSFSFASPSVTGSSQGEDSAKPTFSLEPTVKFAEPTTPPKAKEEVFIFGSPGTFEFSFSGVKTKSPRSRDVSVCESEEGVVKEVDRDHLYFKPVIPLPDKVDVITGEENEEVLYSHRAKVYRLIQGEWKERGIGDLKFLKHNKTGKIRLLMRREQVLKLCLNHYMAADMEFRKKDDKTYYWVATDFSDGEPKRETFTARFKTSEIAHEFLAAVSNSKVQLCGLPLDLETSTVDTTTKEVVTSIGNDNTKTEGLLAGVPAPIFSAVSPATSSQTTTSDSSSATKVFGTILPHAATSPIVSTSPKEPQPCASTSTTASIQTPAASLTKVEPEVLPEKDNEEEADNDRYIEDDHDPCPDFVPIIPLPDKVEVCTMEEDEEVLFEDRSKLFRFVEKEWKEQGTGMIKLLYNKEKQTVRVLMRRDQTHKVCANHLINNSITPQFMANNDKTLMWGAQDFADEELRTEKFCSRFKTSEIAANFKAAFENAKKLVVEKERSGDDEATAEEPATEAPAPQKPLSELFKPTARSWSCDTCLVRNDPDKNVCVSCQTPNPSSTAVSTLTTDSTSLAGGGFKFGTTPSTTSESSSLARSTGSFKFGSSTQPIVPAVSQSSSDGINLGIGSDTETAAATTEQSKFSLGGFTFSSAPIVKPEENIVEKPVEEKKDSIFAKFSLTTAKDTSTSSVFPPFSFNFTTTTTTTSQAGAAVSRPAPISSGTFSFTSVACDINSITTDSSKGESKPSLFRDTVFNPNSTSVAKADESQDGEAEEYEPQVDFKPVIPMPDLVEVKTGEENEDQLFCERAKLFRYDAKEWKERGIGEFKILRDKKSGKVRILMRREKIHKICANHLINQDMKLGTLPSSDRAWVWGALDYADEEVKEERFAVKFKTPEVANKFKEVFEEAQKTLGKEEKEKSTEAEPEPAPETKSESEPVVSRSTDVTSAPSLASLFKPAPGSWECSGCFIRNKAEVNTCPACNTNKPGYEPPTVEETKTPAFSFGLGKSIFGSAPSTASTTTTVSFSFSCSKPQTTIASSISTSTSTVFSGFKFSPTNTSKESSTTKAFTFGTPQTSNKSITSTTPFSFSFASPSVTGSSQGEDSTKPTFSLEPTFKFAEPTIIGSPGKFEFSLSGVKTKSPSPSVTGSSQGEDSTKPTFSLEPTFKFAEPTIIGSPGKFEFSLSGVKTKSPRSRDVSVCESEEGVVEEDDGDHLYFEPVIPLPDKVDVVTGEENEEVLYSHRAKLYRLIQGEWKERGIGDIKVLKHNKTGKIRLLMRREQVLKLCLNHYMAADMEFRKKDDKTYYWVATDFSDGEPKKETFAARFKTSEIAHEFLAAVSNSKVELGGSPLDLEMSTVDTTTKEVVTTSIANDNTKTEVFGGLSSFSSSPKTTFSFGDKFSTSSPVSSTGIPDSEVSIVFEKKATPEQVEKARKLKLPDNFYLYEQAEPCKGCIGCQENQENQDVQVILYIFLCMVTISLLHISIFILSE
ncbi:E3 SUMO-protein ligase RanBP2-like isoform X4 [Oratosquilla oratoria]|uniref:E3 SUMO-protein ligase RanBP2-like isoform X4 n=1 Tax=Oratosquilla oratoria TaxID=337810 RepID=UPI003F76D928